MQLTRTHQRYCVGDDCSEASRWSPHNRECSSCWPEKTTRYFLLRVAVRTTHSAAAEEGLISMRRTIFTAPAPVQWADYLSSVSTRLDFLCSQICHAVSFKWNTFRKSKVCHRLAAPGTGHPWLCPHWERGMYVRSCCGQWTDAGHIKQAAALNARRLVSTRSTLNLWRNQWMALSIRLCSSHRHFLQLKKVVFFPLQDQIRSLHAQDTLKDGPRSCIFRSPMLLFVYCCTYTFGSGQCSSHGGAVSTCHSFASREPMFSYFGQKVQDRLESCFFKPRKLLLASIKPPWKFKAFNEV